MAAKSLARAIACRAPASRCLTYLIEEGDPSMTDDGIPIARHGHRATCGYHLISSLL
jgi:uncharacterized Zn-binding protein involved in type VI secretion